MLNGKKILVVIPARGGSKGIPLKNLKKINNQSLIWHVSNSIKNLKYIDKKIISTDHSLITKEAKRCNIEVPFIRPQKISGDRVSDLAVLTHALKTLEEKEKIKYDIVVMLQPTCPLRQPKHVDKTIKKIINKKLDACWTVSEIDLKFHPKKILKIENKKLNHYDNAGRKIIARQQLEPLYFRNGAAYAFTRDCILNKKTILPSKCGFILIEDKLVNIDTKEDLKRAQITYSKK